jgi:hypothetical protein
MPVGVTLDMPVGVTLDMPVGVTVWETFAHF